MGGRVGVAKFNERKEEKGGGKFTATVGKKLGWVSTQSLVKRGVYNACGLPQPQGRVGVASLLALRHNLDGLLFFVRVRILERIYVSL